MNEEKAVDEETLRNDIVFSDLTDELASLLGRNQNGVEPCHSKLVLLMEFLKDTTDTDARQMFVNELADMLKIPRSMVKKAAGTDETKRKQVPPVVPTG